MCHHGRSLRSVWPTSFPSFLSFYQFLLVGRSVKCKKM
ncbi:hypothetical protein LEMLEM_LOCUS27014 [Lemmus lemmus]